jgi:curved DNA-binding protein CbpA
MPSKPKSNPYRVLGLRNGADDEDIRKAFFVQAVACHPDRVPDNPIALERFTALLKAHDILSDPEKRKFFDETGMVDDEDVEDDDDPIDLHVDESNVGVEDKRVPGFWEDNFNKLFPQAASSVWTDVLRVVDDSQRETASEIETVRHFATDN